MSIVAFVLIFFSIFKLFASANLNKDNIKDVLNDMQDINPMLITGALTVDGLIGLISGICILCVL